MQRTRVLQPQRSILQVEAALGWKVTFPQQLVVARLQSRVSDILRAGQDFKAAIFHKGIYQRELDAEMRADLQADVALRLPELARREDWSRHETQAGAEAVYSRAFAAARFLVKRYSFELTVQLLRENRNGDLTRFEEVLARTTGMSTDALDAAVGEWVLRRTAPLKPPPDQGARGPHSARRADRRAHHAGLQAPGCGLGGRQLPDGAGQSAFVRWAVLECP